MKWLFNKLIPFNLNFNTNSSLLVSKHSFQRFNECHMALCNAPQVGIYCRKKNRLPERKFLSNLITEDFSVKADVTLSVF